MILVDTSGLLSALFEDQTHHAAAAHILSVAEPYLIVSPFVVAETDYLIQKFGGVRAELLFLEELERGAYEVPDFSPADFKRAREIVDKYSDLQIGLADASIVVLAERYDCRDVLTLDRRHFETLRIQGRTKFRILPSHLR